MTAPEIVAALKKLANPAAKKNWVNNGGAKEPCLGVKVADMKARRAALGLASMTFGMAAYAIVRDTDAEAQAELARITTLSGDPPAGYANFEQWLSGTELERAFQIQEYSVSNRGLRPGLVGPNEGPPWACTTSTPLHWAGITIR